MKLTPECLWALLGGKPWLSPLNATPFRRLVRRAVPYTFDAVVSIALANYRTHYALALDCNLPSDERNDHKIAAINYGCELGNRLDWLTSESPPTCAKARSLSPLLTGQSSATGLNTCPALNAPP